jgi:hypothetical protein
MRRHAALSWLSVFTSSATLVCCALPALLVALGAGAVLAGLVSTVPQLVWLSENKLLVFGTAGVLLGVAGALQWQARRAASCPTDPALAAACADTKDWSLAVYYASVAMYAVGAFFAFAAPALLA